MIYDTAKIPLCVHGQERRLCLYCATPKAQYTPPVTSDAVQLAHEISNLIGCDTWTRQAIGGLIANIEETKNVLKKLTDVRRFSQDLLEINRSISSLSSSVSSFEEKPSYRDLSVLENVMLARIKRTDEALASHTADCKKLLGEIAFVRTICQLRFSKLNRAISTRKKRVAIKRKVKRGLKKK